MRSHLCEPYDELAGFVEHCSVGTRLAMFLPQDPV